MSTKIRPFNLHTSVDSHVKGLIDSAYIQARQTAGTDSASTQAMIDSNFENSITFGNDVTFDSSGGVLFDKSDQSLKFGDNIPIKFGNGGDLLIRHEAQGSNSVIREAGSGSLFIDATNLFLRSGSFEKFASFTANGQAELFHNNIEKFSTTDSGGKITGNIASNIRSNPKGFSVTHTVDSSDNALLVGPINVDSGVTLTVNGTLMVV